MYNGASSLARKTFEATTSSASSDTLAEGLGLVRSNDFDRSPLRIKKQAQKGTPGASIETVEMSGNEDTDTSALQAFGTIDAILDLTPPDAAMSTHLMSALAALRRGGRCSAMGFSKQPIVGWNFVGKNITLKGKLMYERDDMVLFMKMLERGLFPTGQDFVKANSFKLSDWKNAFDIAAEHTGIGKVVSIAP